MTLNIVDVADRHFTAEQQYCPNPIEIQIQATTQIALDIFSARFLH